MTPYQPTRWVLWVEAGQGPEGSMLAQVTPDPWPENLPSLADELGGKSAV